MIVRFQSARTGKWLDVDDDQPSERSEYPATAAVLELCGGGLNSSQTARAMQTMALIRQGDTVHIAGYEIRRMDTATAEQEGQA